MMSRRQLMLSAAAMFGMAAASGRSGLGDVAAAVPVTVLRAETRVIEVKGRPATVFGLRQPDGTHGLVLEAGQRFRVRLENRLREETLVHWHGLRPPWQQDGVPGVSQPPLAPGDAYEYDFPLDHAGTFWMHSHYGLQEQRLLAAPLIVREPGERTADIQEVVVIFHDFSFRDPAEIFWALRGAAPAHGGHGSHGHGPTAVPQQQRAAGVHAESAHAAGHGAMAHAMTAAVHLHDVSYDAFLANDRTLDDPAVYRVERAGRVRLRLINGASATNFWLELGELRARLIAVDGQPVVPVEGRQFEFAIAQRLDLLIDLPAEEGAWPILAVREGDRLQTGVILATAQGRIRRVADTAEVPVPPIGLAGERQLRAADPLPPRPADRHHLLILGEAPGYVWLINGAAYPDGLPLAVAQGERIELTFVNDTTMAHPMHLHGHPFQVVAIDGERFDGAVRDTVFVPARGRVTIAFDADRDGRWALHCHHLYHMAAGMMTTVEYRS
jgi:FtsP/CotA-like multicopper oxidase with cupredoxin domain